MPNVSSVSLVSNASVNSSCGQFSCPTTSVSQKCCGLSVAYPAPPIQSPGMMAEPDLAEVQGGLLPTFTWRPACYVIAEAWPCWLSVVESLGLTCASILSSSLTFHADWEPFQVSVPWSQSFDIPHLTGDTPSVLCISGSLAFVEPFWVLYAASHVLWVALDLDVVPSPAMQARGSWHCFSHLEAGGVTSGSWWCGVSYSTPSLKANLAQTSSRRVGQCIVATGSGPACPPPGPEDLGPLSLFPLSTPDVNFVCASVFSPTKWVSRPLTLFEIGRVCDLPEVVAQSFAARWGTVSCATPFLTGAPQKLLYAVGRRFREGLRGGFDKVDKVDKLEFMKDQGPGASSPPGLSPAAFAPLLQQPSAPEVGSVNENELGRNKAAKADDAPVNTDLWDSQLWSGLTEDHVERAISFLERKGCSPLVTLRNWFLGRWWRSLWRSLRRYMRRKYGPAWSCPVHELQDKLLQDELEASRECLAKAMAADWWDWLAGSRLFFWRWPEESQLWALRGLPVWLLSTPTPYRRPQQYEPNPLVREQVAVKLEKFRLRDYIAIGFALGLISYFVVPKGDSDVRVVFDATKSGLNECIWCPSFGLPTVDTLLEALEPGTWQADIDLGEMFYNFMLDPAITRFCGVDLSPFFGDGRKRMAWEVWRRCIMGLKPSPYGCIRMELLHSETTVGLHRKVDNPFYYDYVRLNLPGDPLYDPRLPRVSRVVALTGRLAGAVHTYVDDKRCSGSSRDHCISVTRRVASIATYFGIQDAPRKRVWPSLRAGAWTGSVAHTDLDKVTVLCTQEKWLKAQNHIKDMNEVLVSKGGVFNYKTLESQRGFLVYVIRTYPSIKPYLKGIHLTIDSWRPHRDDDGWMSTDLMRQYLAEKDGSYIPPLNSKAHPETVRAVPRLRSDIDALQQLFAPDTPPRRVIRSTKVIVVYYGFADASGGGFGSTVVGPSGVRYRYGVWNEDIAGRSSNYRELRNVVEAVEDQVRAEYPQLARMIEEVEQCAHEGWYGAEFYLFTDNSVAEAAFYKGTSSNRALFDLVLRLRQLELHHSFSLHVVHVSGRRMIAQGTDGLSRGDFSDGVMRGKSMHEFIPLHLSALQLSAGLLEYCRSWCPPSLSLLPLSPDDWYVRGHGLSGGKTNLDNVWTPLGTLTAKHILVWAPPPAAADSAIEQLGLSRHKRPHIPHLFVCPRLMTHLWRKKLYKFADVVFYLPAGRSPRVWSSARYEPLVIGLFVPYSSSFPWCFRRCSRFLELEGQLRAVWKDSSRDERTVLREFWVAAGFAF